MLILNCIGDELEAYNRSSSGFHYGGECTRRFHYYSSKYIVITDCIMRFHQYCSK